MKAMILAAGKGTRLKPLTDTMPKALVPVGGTPLLEKTIHRLIDAGCREIIINVHHFAQQIIDYLAAKTFPGIEIKISDETRQLLDTGGGIAEATRRFGEEQPLLIHNVDIVSTIDLRALYNQHLASGADATLAVSERPTSRYLLFQKNDNRLQGWINKTTGETKPDGNTFNFSQINEWAFSGIHVISPRTLHELKKQSGKFSIIDFYLEQMKSLRIKGLLMSGETIIDIGKITTFEEANNYIRKTGL